MNPMKYDRIQTWPKTDRPKKTRPGTLFYIRRLQRGRGFSGKCKACIPCVPCHSGSAAMYFFLGKCSRWNVESDALVLSISFQNVGVHSLKSTSKIPRKIREDHNCIWCAFLDSGSQHGNWHFENQLQFELARFRQVVMIAFGLSMCGMRCTSHVARLAASAKWKSLPLRGFIRTAWFFHSTAVTTWLSNWILVLEKQKPKLFKHAVCRRRRTAGKRWMQLHRNYQTASSKWGLLLSKRYRMAQVIAMTRTLWLVKSMAISSCTSPGDIFEFVAFDTRSLMALLAIEQLLEERLIETLWKKRETKHLPCGTEPRCTMCRIWMRRRNSAPWTRETLFFITVILCFWVFAGTLIRLVTRWQRLLLWSLGSIGLSPWRLLYSTFWLNICLYNNLIYRYTQNKYGG